MFHCDEIELHLQTRSLLCILPVCFLCIRTVEWRGGGSTDTREAGGTSWPFKWICKGALARLWDIRNQADSPEGEAIGQAPANA